MEKVIFILILATAVIGFLVLPLETEVQTEVTGVVDGDTIKAEWNNKTHEVRLKGIDTPEVNTENQPFKFEGVENSPEGKRCLKKWGGNASKRVEREILDQEVALKFSRFPFLRRGNYGRILAEVEFNGTSLNRKLVEEGLARSYTENGPYIEEERKAKLNMRGVWKCQLVS